MGSKADEARCALQLASYITRISLRLRTTAWIKRPGNELQKSSVGGVSSSGLRPAPYSHLEDVFVPLYFLHRYQTEAVAKIIGGSEYNYAVRGPVQCRSNLNPPLTA